MSSDKSAGRIHFMLAAMHQTAADIQELSGKPPITSQMTDRTKLTRAQPSESEPIRKWYLRLAPPSHPFERWRNRYYLPSVSLNSFRISAQLFSSASLL